MPNYLPFMLYGLGYVAFGGLLLWLGGLTKEEEEQEGKKVSIARQAMCFAGGLVGLFGIGFVAAGLALWVLSLPK